MNELPPLTEVVKHFVKLQETPSGNLRGFCPFCKTSLPVFQVSPTKGFWHCLGCQEGGDVQQFVEKLRREE